jgi:hypothetical protein
MKWVLVIEPSEVDREYLERIITRPVFRCKERGRGPPLYDPESA